MEYSKYAKMNLPGPSDDADIGKVSDNFKTLDKALQDGMTLANRGEVFDNGTDFKIQPVFPVGEVSPFSLTAKFPRAYKEGDTVTVEDKAYNLYQGTDPALGDVWKIGEVVTLNFDQTSRRCWASAGGGAPRPLPPQVSNLNATAPEGETPSIVLTWTNPVDDNFSGLIVVMKEGSAPNGVADGQQIYKGDSTTVTVTEGIEWEHSYYFRAFAYNSQGKYQMDATGAITNVTPSNVPDAVSGLTLEENKAKATIKWTNPTNASYSVTKVVQKINSAPQTPTDGTEVYSGPGTTCTVENLQDSINYHWAVFAVSKTGKYSPAPSVSYTPKLIPKGYTFLTCLTQNTEYQPPADDIYRITCFGKSADGTNGGRGYIGEAGDGGDGGGSGGLARSILELTSSQKVHCTINPSVSSFGEYLSATGASGTNGGRATGGNSINSNGSNGGKGGEGESINMHDEPNYSKYSPPYSGYSGGNKGAQGGTEGAQGYRTWRAAGGGGGGGARYNVPDVPFDDPLYTKYTVSTLSEYSGGSGGDADVQNFNGGSASQYPRFNSKSPVWYGGGSGGGGGGTDDEYGGQGSAGSPGGILIEKAVWE